MKSLCIRRLVVSKHRDVVLHNSVGCLRSQIRGGIGQTVSLLSFYSTKHCSYRNFGHSEQSRM